ncbi:hypothetical protein KP509_02G017300 [Ceratopteris richardii]|uniref:Uncharacterized protein n=1 Tax=Ceratopteris richardii TaxID=49495 RepID=A0A8T2V7L6_CERRI|nr:hypothetical protein KP509_02G017300 [Ceratopteris richardii]KAH7443059.1 hypothetical protein KP509_02G017300 [Ceratopteris richardii]KAH7443060.1 hypothetical protein KP509_02G017300 [Ceratopteris richardii]
MFLLAYFMLWTRKRILHFRSKHYSVSNGFHVNKDVPTQVRYGLRFKTSLFCCIYLLLANIFTLLWCAYLRVFKDENLCHPLYAIASPLVQAVSWIVMIISLYETKKRGKLVFPCMLRTWWIVAFLFVAYSSVYDFQVLFRNFHKYASIFVCMNVSKCPAAAVLCIAAIFGNCGIYHVKSDLHEPLLSHSREEEVETQVTPYSNAGFLSIATLSWLDPLLSLGSRKPLELRDVPLLATDDRIETSYLRLKAALKHLKFEDPVKQPSLIKAITISFWKEAVRSGAFATINTFASYVGPYLITDFVDYLSGVRRFKNEGYILAFFFLSSKLAESLAQRQWYMGIDLLGMHVRNALTAFVYRKGLRLSSKSRQSHSGGEIINYMSVDVQRVGDFSWYLHDSWILPLQILLALGILYRSVGIAFIATLTATIISIVANTPLARLQEDYQDNLMSAKDERMRATAECLRSMKILKLQAWESRYQAKLEAMRKEEYRWLRKALFAQAAVTFIFWGAPVFVSVVTFGTCVLLGIPLTAGRVLSALATFRILQEPLRSFPDLVAMIAQTRVSLDRISSFLEEEELPKDAVSRVSRTSDDLAIEIKDGTFSWDSSSATMPTLLSINLKVSKGMRVAVCGKVGAGKTSLLSCILGEMPKLSGMVKVCGQTAYVSQSAWIQSGTIEGNILFGDVMDKTKYKNVLQVCALKKDMTLFSHGDQTIVGERGINLSGGQKQRIQLARALYKDADIYLLDDPFSAVDAHTGSELFKECLLGALADKTVIFVTHQVEFLSAADLILVLRDGEIIQAGKYDDLLQAGTDFDTLVSAHNEAIESMDVNEYVTDESEESEKPTSVVNAEEESSKNCEIERVTSLKSERLSAENQLSVMPNQKKAKAKRLKKKQLVQEEEREKGRVSWRVYWSYMTAAYGGLLIPIIVLAQLAFQLLQVGSNWWMAWASPATDGHQSRSHSVRMIMVYMILAFASAFCVFLRAFLVSVFGLKAAQKLFLTMNESIFSAPMSFFDSTPTGRILNRVSSDQSVVDLDIPFRLASFASTTIQLLAIIGVMSQVTWQILLLFLPVASICLWLQRYYMASARELTRLIGIQKSPIIHHFGESISGAATIRGFDQQKRYIRTNFTLVDNYSRPYFHSFSAVEWLCLRMELLSTFVFAFLMFLLVRFPLGNIDPSMAGLAITYGLNLNARQSRWVLSLCKLENKIISVERIQQYTRLPREAPRLIANSRALCGWPTVGTVEFHDLKVRYAAHLPLVLHSINCCFPGGKKVGVVGRTGSGKSTLIQALFRIVEPSGGTITIDGVDITSIGLHDLRSRLSIIPQDPTLFEGTIRVNLDPLEEHSDAEIWEALDKCQLGDVLRSKELKLDTLVTENGENWSVGQRQLLCLGRALLRHTQILVLDEATASVDTATDGLIQRTIREELSSCTVITIAHRIPTVIDSDYVLVLSDGRVVEFDTPINLLEDKTSAFLKLVSEYMLRSSSISDPSQNEI